MTTADESGAQSTMAKSDGARRPTFSAFYRAVIVMALLWPLEWAVFGNLFKHSPHGGKIVDAIVLATFLLTWFLIRIAMRREGQARSGAPV